MITKEYKTGHYECEKCGESVVASHPNRPEEERFSKDVLIQATFLKYEGKIPYRKVSDKFK